MLITCLDPEGSLWPWVWRKKETGTETPSFTSAELLSTTPFFYLLVLLTQCLLKYFSMFGSSMKTFSMISGQIYLPSYNFQLGSFCVFSNAPRSDLQFNLYWKPHFELHKIPLSLLIWTVEMLLYKFPINSCAMSYELCNAERQGFHRFFFIALEILEFLIPVHREFQVNHFSSLSLMYLR